MTKGWSIGDHPSTSTTLYPVLTKRYFPPTSSYMCCQSLQDSCEGIEWSKATPGWLPNRHIIQLCTSYFSASPLGTNLFSLVWSKHSLDYDCFAHQYKPCPREVLFSKLSFLSSALFWSKLDHDHCWQPCRPGLPEADISFAILRRCRSGPAFCNTDFSPLPCNVFEGL